MAKERSVGHLKEKTVNNNSKSLRKRIPPSVKDYVLREAGYMCGNPCCRHILTLELHHIEWVKEGGGNDPANLLALCPNCHSLHTQGCIPKSAIRHWKGILHALNHAFNKESMDLLLFLKFNTEPIFLSGDGVLRFASLIAAGLAESYVGSSSVQLHVTLYIVKLTDKGSALVDAWLTGDEEQYAKTLSSGRS